MRTSFNILAFCLFFLLVQGGLKAQGSLVQFSGVVMTSDSLKAISYVSIFSESNYRGTISDYKGYFSLVARKGDTIVFSALGYEDAQYVVPLNLQGDKFSVIQLMTMDTVHLDPTLIYPWPSKEEFKEAFLTLNIPDDDLERARKNLAREKLREAGKTLPKDPNEQLDYVFKEHANSFYYLGQQPPMMIFNIFSWVEFIKAWKRGDFKNKN